MCIRPAIPLRGRFIRWSGPARPTLAAPAGPADRDRPDRADSPVRRGLPLHSHAGCAPPDRNGRPVVGSDGAARGGRHDQGQESVWLPNGGRREAARPLITRTVAATVGTIQSTLASPPAKPTTPVGGSITIMVRVAVPCRLEGASFD